jgi:prepilin-type N-terminal cleavage/methylation domain-containing protein
MTRRQGTTLTEVLVAIFVMGIGAMAIMAMFPLAAVSMARSIKDDRVGHAAANAKAIAIAKSIRQDGQVNAFFDNPRGNTTTGPTPAGGNYANAPLNGQSWAVYCDPFGFANYTGNAQNFVAGQTSGIRRRSLSFILAPTNATLTPTVAMLSYCTLLDEITFGTNGQPVSIDGGPVTAGTFVDRGRTVSYAWLLRRPMAGAKTICDLTVVIYNKRPSTGAAAGQELAYTIQVNATQPNMVTVTWNPGAGIPQPQIIEGGWILDITPGPVDPTTKLKSPGNAKFYRVVSMSDITVAGANQSMDLELANPMPATANTIAVMNGVVEVIECGDSWRSWNN